MANNLTAILPLDSSMDEMTAEQKSEYIEQFDFHVDLLQALLWQYNDAERLQTILNRKNNWYNANTEQFWKDWYTNVFNLDTCNFFGIRVWSAILNIYFLTMGDLRETSDTWGFDPLYMNFNNGNFAIEDIVGGTANIHRLTLEQSRLVLKARYLTCISRGTLSEVNRALQLLFGEGSQVIDNGSMTASMVVFTEQLSPGTKYMIENFNIIPMPSTIGFLVREVTGGEFGFNPHGMNFFKGFFSPESITPAVYA